MARVYHGSIEGLAVRMAADDATSLEHCEAFLTQIAEGGRRVGIFLDNLLSPKGRQAAIDFQEGTRSQTLVQGVTFYESAYNARQEESRLEMEKIEADSYSPYESEQKLKESVALGDLRRTYGPRHLMKSKTRWPFQ